MPYFYRVQTFILFYIFNNRIKKMKIFLTIISHVGLYRANKLGSGACVQLERLSTAHFLKTCSSFTNARWYFEYVSNYSAKSVWKMKSTCSWPLTPAERSHNAVLDISVQCKTIHALKFKRSVFIQTCQS